MRRDIGLKDTPHWTTLHKAAKRLLRLPNARRLLDASVARFMGRRRNVRSGAMDSTGLDAGHASRYGRKGCDRKDPDRDGRDR